MCTGHTDRASTERFGYHSSVDRGAVYSCSLHGFSTKWPGDPWFVRAILEVVRWWDQSTPIGQFMDGMGGRIAFVSVCCAPSESWLWKTHVQAEHVCKLQLSNRLGVDEVREAYHYLGREVLRIWFQRGIPNGLKASQRTIYQAKLPRSTPIQEFISMCKHPPLNNDVIYVLFHGQCHTTIRSSQRRLKKSSFKRSLSIKKNDTNTE
jgi:hypothetical protein